MILYLKCESEGIVASTRDENLIKGKSALCKTKKEFSDFILNESFDLVVCSSSMDFPKDYTDNEEIINLCNKIRNCV